MMFFITFDQFLLLGSIVVPALVSMMLFTGFFRSDESAKKLGYLAFVFPFFSGIILFFRFDSSVDGYAFEIFVPEWDYKSLRFTFILV